MGLASSVVRVQVTLLLPTLLYISVSKEGSLTLQSTTKDTENNIQGSKFLKVCVRRKKKYLELLSPSVPCGHVARSNCNYSLDFRDFSFSPIMSLKFINKLLFLKEIMVKM